MQAVENRATSHKS